MKTSKPLSPMDQHSASDVSQGTGEGRASDVVSLAQAILDARGYLVIRFGPSCELPIPAPGDVVRYSLNGDLLGGSATLPATTMLVMCETDEADYRAQHVLVGLTYSGPLPARFFRVNAE
jgi:hypothetical protein